MNKTCSVVQPVSPPRWIFSNHDLVSIIVLATLKSGVRCDLIGNILNSLDVRGLHTCYIVHHFAKNMSLTITFEEHHV